MQDKTKKPNPAYALQAVWNKKTPEQKAEFMSDYNAGKYDLPEEKENSLFWWYAVAACLILFLLYSFPGFVK